MIKNQSNFYKLIFLFLLFISIWNNSYSQGDTMYVDGRYIYSAAGEKVILRGVNEMYQWSSDKTGRWSLAEIAKTGANCVRLVWGNGQSTSSLATLIDNCVKHKMIAMPECHDATGDWSKLDDCVNFWNDPKIISAVNRNKKWTMVNIANEAGNGNVSSTAFRSGYKNAIDSLRKWGYTVPIVIDASTWGQNVDILFATWKELIEHDSLKNVVFSAHSYWSTPTNYQRIADKAKSENMPVIIGEGPSPTAYPNCKILDYKKGLTICGQNEIGWLAWSWGLVSNGHCKPNFDMTTNGRFGYWETTHSRIMVYEHPYSLMRTAERPPSFYSDSIVRVTGMEIMTNKNTIEKRDSVKIDVIVAPLNAADRNIELKIYQNGEFAKFNKDSSYIIGISEGSLVVQATHLQTGIKTNENITIITPVSAGFIQNSIAPIQAFPNPATNNIKLTFPVQADFNATITIISGRVIEEISGTGDFELNLSQYKSGLYFIKFEYLDRYQTLKFVKN